MDGPNTGTPALGTADTVGETGESPAPTEITPSRRSSRKKQSTFSDDFEYYTPTGRKKEEEKKPTPQPVSTGKQKENQEEEEEVKKGAKKPLLKKKIAQRKGKGVNQKDAEEEESEDDEEEEEEEEEEEKEVPKRKVGKGKPKVVAKKITKKTKAAPNKKKAIKKQKEASDDDDEEEEEEEDSSEEEEEAKAKTTKKRKSAAAAKKKPPAKVAKTKPKKQKIEEDEEEEEESSSDEEDSTPISQLQAQLKAKQKQSAVGARESPLAQNLAKKMAEEEAESSSLDTEGGKSPAKGQKRRLGQASEDGVSPLKKTPDARQFEKLGSALASLVKRIPPSDLGLVKRSPSEMAVKVGKPAGANASASLVKEDTGGTEIKVEAQPVVAEGVKPTEEENSEEIKAVDKVKKEGDSAEQKVGSANVNASAKKKKPAKLSSEVKSEKDKGKEKSELEKVKTEPEKNKEMSNVKKSKLKTVIKNEKSGSVTAEVKAGKESSQKKGGKELPPKKLSESELRQKKIEQIKAKIAEKSGGQKTSFMEKQRMKKEHPGVVKSSPVKHAIKKEDKKDSELHQKKLESIKAKVEASSRKISTLPSHLLKKHATSGKKLEGKGLYKHGEDVVRKGVVHKKKSHQPFGHKNIVVRKTLDKSQGRESLDKSSDQKGKSEKAPQSTVGEKKNKMDRAKNKLGDEKGRVEEREKKRKSVDGVKPSKEERRKSGDGSSKKPGSSSAEKRRKSSGTGEDSMVKDEKKVSSTEEPPVLSPANAAAPKPKHKHHKVEHEVPIDMSMMDLFKPDGLIAHEPGGGGAAGAAGNTSQLAPGQAAAAVPSSSTSPGCVRPEDVENVLLEHQYSKPSSPEAGFTSPSKAAGASSTTTDVESVSHCRSVVIDASLPEQILEDSAEEPVLTVDGDRDGAKVGEEVKEENSSDRPSILQSLGTELRESGTDFLIVGQVEVNRQAADSPSADKTATQKSSGPSSEKKGASNSAAVSRKRRDSEKSSEARKRSTDSRDKDGGEKKKDKAHKKDSKKKDADGKDKGKPAKEAGDGGESEEEDEEFEDDENDIDWEDPDTLYCLCRKPHNNRFMICCDKCEEWYHGTCVGITRARGKEMEDNEEEYTCPICIKGDGVSFLEKAPDSSKSTEMSSPSTPKLLQKCVGRKCSKTPRPGSVYCSNECIMNHAQESLKVIREEQAKKVSKERHQSSHESSSKNTPSSSSSSSKPSSSSSPSSSSPLDVVEVMERESGKILRGPSAPTQKGLHRWLEQHPSFEVVQPHKHRSSSSTSRDSRDSKDSRDGKHGHSHSSDKDRRSSSSGSRDKDRRSDRGDERGHRHHHHHQKDLSRQESSSSNTSSRDHHSAKKIEGDRRHSSSSSSSSLKVESSSSKKDVRRRDSDSGGPNQIRINVRTALRDSLTARAKEADDILLSGNEIKALALTVEEKLFEVFQDTGHKYRAKYRSLVFNIKDQKNKGLFRKILTGKVTPDKLVLMSTEELASRELAKWREQENKHQLEMIEKLEKEKQTAKSAGHVTKKTHKGEIEVDDEDLSTLETRLEEKKAAEPEKSEDANKEPVIDTTAQHRAHLFDANCKVCTGKVVPGPEEQAAVASLSTPGKKTGMVQFSLPPEKDKDKEKEEEEEKSQNSSTITEDERKKEEKKKRVDDEVKAEDYDKAAEIVAGVLKHVQKVEDEMSALPSMVSSSPLHHDQPALSPPISPGEEPPDIDDDLGDEGVEEEKKEKEVITPISPSPAKPPVAPAAKAMLPLPVLPPETSKASSSAPSSSSADAAEKRVIVRSPDSALQSGLEAKAKFTPTSPVLWKGFVSMLDVAKFFTSAYRVSGPTDHVSIPDTIHIMGRISPDHMWDYLSKIRQAGSKDITVLRFIPGSDEEKVAYIHLYSYLNSRARCGVANNPSRQVKDFYVVPLASHSKIPRTLLPFDGPGLEENRPHMLIGILVRQRDKHSKEADSPHSSTSSSTSHKAGKKAKDSEGGSSKVRQPLAGASRDPRLAKLAAAKAASPKHSPTSSSSSSINETKSKEPQSSLETDEYDPEYVPMVVKTKGTTSQPVAEYIPTPTAKKKDRDSKDKSSTDDKSGVKSKTPSPEDSASPGGGKEKRHHQYHKERHHRHHHHHHKDHHSHQHQKKVEEDDSEPYSPGKEAEPYSPGQEAAAEEPYDPEDESLMDEDGHPIISATTTTTSTAVSPAASTATTTATPLAKSTPTASSVSSSATATTADSGSIPATSPGDNVTETTEELVERMARSNDPGQISSLMVTALSQASTQQQQQEMLVQLTRQVEDRKLQLAGETRSTGGSGPAQDTTDADSGENRKQLAEEERGELAVVSSSSSASGEGKSSEEGSAGKGKPSSLPPSLSSSSSTVASGGGVTTTAGGKADPPQTVGEKPASPDQGLSLASIPLPTDSLSPFTTPTNTLPAPAKDLNSNSSGSGGAHGIKFSIKPVSKAPLKPALLGGAFSAQNKPQESSVVGGTSINTPTADTDSKSVGPENSGREGQKVNDGAEESIKPQLPDALKALMNDVMGNTEAPSLERRRKMLMRKEAERAAAMEAGRKAKSEGEEGSEKEAENEQEEEEKEEEQQQAATVSEAQKRLDDEAEARMILEGLKKPNPPVTENAPKLPASESSDSTPKPTTAPSIDELLERLKKGGFQFPLQKPADSPDGQTAVTPPQVSSSGAGPSSLLSSSSSSLPPSSATIASSSTFTSASSSSLPPPASAQTKTTLTTTAPPPPNPSVPTYSAPAPFLPSLSLSSLASSSVSPSLSSSSQDVDLRVGHSPQPQPPPPVSSTPPPDRLQDRDDRALFQDRDDRPFRGANPPKHPLDPHAFPPLPGGGGGGGGAPYAPPYQPTPRSVLPPKGRAQPPPPGTEFDRPAEVLGITDVDMRRPPLPPPLPPQPPPPLPPLPHHQYREDIDYRDRGPYRPHHGYSRGRGGHPYHRH